MRSSHELATLVVIALAACGTDGLSNEGAGGGLVPIDDATCETSFLDYENFAEPFVLDWCRGCHSAAIPEGMRQKAPDTVNFDTFDDVRSWAPRIGALAASSTPEMPPAGGPTLEERRLLAEWLACGMR